MLVTGAASGIGSAVAQLLRAHDVEVVATDISAPGLVPLDEAGAETLVADVTRCEDRARCLAAAAGADGLVNAAGAIDPMPIEDVTDEAWDRSIAVNLKASFFLARDVGRRMPSGGAIVNLSSLAARYPNNTDVLCYAASKAAVLAMTRGLAHAFGGRGVRVNAVLPGLIDTPMQARVLEGIAAIRGEPRSEVAAARAKLVPLEQRTGSARECAEAIVFLLSGAASYITGQALGIDGGAVMP
ncbi:MAG: SDR family oxidoreductase [Conexibacter sp.]